MVPLASSALSRAQREAVQASKRRPKSKEAGIEFRRGHMESNPCSTLDGPLSQLLQQRYEAQRTLDQLNLNLEEFLAAAQYLIDQADGKPVLAEEALRPGVRHWLREISTRSLKMSALHSPPRVQRED